MLKTVISSLWMLSAVLLIVSVLLHSPKGDGMGGLASSGGSMFTSARSAEQTLTGSAGPCWHCFWGWPWC